MNFFQDLWFNNFLLFLLAFLVAVCIAPFSILIAKKLDMLDYPSKEAHKIHSHPTPVSGGFIIISSLFIVFALNWTTLSAKFNVYLLLAFVFIFLAGLDDDLSPLSARKKLAAQFVAASMIIIGGYQVTIFEFEPANIFITLLWLIGITNAFNFLDGSDGLVTGISIIICAFLSLFTYLTNQPTIHLFAIIMTGTLLGVFIFNTHPAKLFLGDSGAQLVGLIIGFLAMEYNPLGFEKSTSWISPILVMAVPIFDVTLVIISRMRRKASVYRSNLDHTIHRLRDMGLSLRAATSIIFGSTIVANLIAFGILFLDPLTAILLFAVTLFAGLGLIIFLETKWTKT